MSDLVPGNDGDPLPGEESVIRLAKGIPNRRAGADESAHVAMFADDYNLSSADKRGIPPHLSVYAERLTECRQAWRLLGGRPPYQWQLRFQVDGARRIRVPGQVEPIDVRWFRAKVPDGLGNYADDTRPGSMGHAGVINLEKPQADNRECKLIRKALRSELAKISSVRPITPDEMRPEEDSLPLDSPSQN